MLRTSHHLLKSLVFVFFLSIIACKSGSSPVPPPPNPAVSLSGTSWSGSVIDTIGKSVAVKLTFGADESYSEDWGVHGKFSGNYTIASNKLTITSTDGANFAGNATIALQNNNNTMVMTDDGGQSITLQKVKAPLPDRPALTTNSLVGTVWEDVKVGGGASGSGATEYRFTISFNTDGTFVYFDPVYNKTTRGTYRVAGDQLTITGTALSGTYTFVIDSALGGLTFQSADGSSWYHYSLVSGGSATVANALSGTSWVDDKEGVAIHFKEDGIYTQTPSTVGEIKNGTYKVEGNQLTLTFDVTEAEKFTFLLNESGSPRRLQLTDDRGTYIVLLEIFD